MSAAVLVNPNKFKGYPVELLRGVKGMGPALIGDDALYQAAKEYNASGTADGSGTALGPALTTKDCTMVIQSISARSLPDTIQPPAVEAAVEASDDDSPSSWDAHDLESLDALCKKHGVTIAGRVKTAGKLIAALEAAGVAP